MARTLVFPAGMPRSIEFARRAMAEGEDVVGASSLPHDPASPLYPTWAYLPFVTDDGFEDALVATVDRLGITRLFSPNPVVWRYLTDLLPRRCPGVRLLGGPPVDREMAPYREAFAFAGDVHAAPLCLAGRVEGRPSIFPKAALAATFKHVDALPGMCDHEKIRALLAVFESVPQGDVVEIGSWWGKSALLLHRLARLRGTGPVLCIDPWAQENLPQGDAKGLVDGTSVSTDEAFEVFLANLSPYAEGHLNYLRMPSDDALAHYRPGTEIRSEAFGTTRYAGRIALLHVDGNHAYTHAKSDIVGWSPFVVPGGWVVVDDYVWPYGDGPKQAGDELLADWAGTYDCAFVAGSALFVRRSAAG